MQGEAYSMARLLLARLSFLALNEVCLLWSLQRADRFCLASVPVHNEKTDFEMQIIRLL